ncbi:MAG: PEP-CTERM sorting domain-containing protein [Opitutaceae bacterium]
MKTNTLILTSAAFLTASLAANAGIAIFGGATGYQSTNKDWLTETTNDIDGNGLGTDGYIFFGNFPVTTPNNNTNPGNDQNENIFGANVMSSTLLTASQPGYISTAATGADSSNIGRYAGYESIDSPILADGTDRVAGNLLVSGPGYEALEFTVSDLAADTTIRVGILTVLNDDDRARFTIPNIRLTDGVNIASVTGLPNLSDGTAGASLGWVFFDIDSDGDYTIIVEGGAPNPTVAGLGGVTFDTVPEPSAYALLAGCLALSSVMLRRRRA